MINIDEEYKGLMAGVLYSGIEKEDRTGTGTISVFGRQISHDMALGFPLLTIKKVFFNNALTELLWMLQGRTDVEYLVRHGVNYWTPDYNRSKRGDGTLGKVYGYQWRNFNGQDQIVTLLNILKYEPYSRRMMVSAWNPADMDDMALPPCHYGFQIYVRGEYLDLIWTQRSVDVFLGLPYDIAIYGLLLQFIATGYGYKPGRLVGQFGDVHLYKNHIEPAKEAIQRKPKTLPTVIVDEGLKLVEENNNYLFIPDHSMITLESYKPHPHIKAKLSVGQ